MLHLYTRLVVLSTAVLIRRGELVRPSLGLLALLTLQITLGALTVVSGKHYIINSLHVVTGAALLATSLVLTLRAHRARFAGNAVRERRYAVGPLPRATNAGARA